MQIVNSTPPLIRLPEAELSQGRYDVRMATEEEARAMDALIRYAGETRNFPGVEAARDAIEEMKEIPMAAGQQGRFTIGLAVANNEAAISHASTLIARADRKSVVWGKSVSVRVDLGGRRFIKKKKHNNHT